MTRPPLVSLGDLTPEEFLARHWQKEPLLIRQALPGFVSPVSSDELAGLACEPDVESRLVLEAGGDHPWQLLHGPFPESQFERLPETHWTLLVQEVNRHVPAVADLMDRFRFVPDWRLDDVMISFAAPSGSVGAHIDSYDVFLLQGMGRRRWEIGPKLEAPEHVPDLDVRILADFRPDRSWVLEPGDMLYLPPGVPHHGVALDPCMTLSIGFLAPDRHEMLRDWLEFFLARSGRDLRYEDPDLRPPAEPGEIAPEVLDRVAGMLEGAPMDRTLLGHWFGRFITRGRRGGPAPEPADPPWDVAEWTETLQDLGALRRSEVVRFSYLREGARAMLFVAGEAFPLDEALAPAAPLLTGPRALSAADLEEWLDRPHFAALLCDLTNQGYFYFEEAG